MRQWKKRGPERAPAPIPEPEPPKRLDDTPELLDKFEQEKILQVPSPDGKGTYTFVADHVNIKGYPMALYWDGKEYGGTVHYHFPGHPPHAVYGGEVAYWFATHWQDNLALARSNDEALAARASQRALVAVILGFIQAGKKIYSNSCGTVMSVDSGM